VDQEGEGTGTLILDTTPNPVDEFGMPITIKAIPPGRYGPPAAALVLWDRTGVAVVAPPA
jgi:hypothetical protein